MSETHPWTNTLGFDAGSDYHSLSQVVWHKCLAWAPASARGFRLLGLEYDAVDANPRAYPDGFYKGSFTVQFLTRPTQNEMPGTRTEKRAVKSARYLPDALDPGHPVVEELRALVPGLPDFPPERDPDRLSLRSVHDALNEVGAEFTLAVDDDPRPAGHAVNNGLCFEYAYAVRTLLEGRFGPSPRLVHTSVPQHAFVAYFRPGRAPLYFDFEERRGVVCPSRLPVFGRMSRPLPDDEWELAGWERHHDGWGEVWRIAGYDPEPAPPLQHA